MRVSCNGCKYYRSVDGSPGSYKICHYLLDTGVKRGCPADNCIHHTKRIKEEEPMPKAVTQDKIDEVRAMRAQGIPVAEIEKLTGVSHNSISKYTKDMKNPAAAATTTGQKESANQEKLSETIVSPITENVKPLAEPTEMLTESEDKPDVKTYEDSHKKLTDERTEGTAAKDVPFNVIVACITRIVELEERLDYCEKAADSIRREIAALEAFVDGR